MTIKNGYSILWFVLLTLITGNSEKSLKFIVWFYGESSELWIRNRINLKKISNFGKQQMWILFTRLFKILIEIVSSQAVHFISPSKFN